MFYVLFFGLGIDQDVIDEYHHKFVEELHEYLIHEIHEIGRALVRPKDMTVYLNMP
jgi:hypothetical protein